MNLNEYEDFVVGLISPASSANRKSRFATAGIGIFAESGEFMDHIKKILFHGSPVKAHQKEIVKELGDIMFYVTYAAMLSESSLEKLVEKSKVISEANKTFHKTVFDEDSMIELLLMAGPVGRYSTTVIEIIKWPELDWNCHLVWSLTDIVCFVSLAAKLFNTSLQKVIDGNVEKLSARYKDKKFTVEEFRAKEEAKKSGARLAAQI